MITGPSKPTIQWGNREVVKEEVKWRIHSKSSWRNILILTMTILAFMVLLFLLDFFG